MQSLLDLLNHFPDEVYLGQKNEIRRMRNAIGCDINEHVPTLIAYGLRVSTIMEMGVRFGWSTRSFLFSRPTKLTSLDKFNWGSIEQAGANPQPNNYYYQHYKKLYDGIVDFNFVIADSTEINPIEPVELLFIDTFHHRDCLAIELEKHGNQATKWILLHDTETFGHCGQVDNSCLFFSKPTTGEPGTGLWAAIQPFLDKNPHWCVHEHYKNNNGLTVLRRG